MKRRATSSGKAKRISTGKHPARIRKINKHAGAVDVGAEEHYAAVPPESVPKGQPAVRSFSAFTTGIDALVEWFKECGVTTVAMESTGIYWIPLFQKLEAAGIKVVLVNARYARNVPGRKTDVQDSQWLQELHSCGLLEGSFRPADDICRLRSLMRHRENIIESAAKEIQHMQKAFQQMNLHLHHVLSDINGVTGMRIIDAILSGQRDPKELVKLRERGTRYKSTQEQMEAALTGDYRPEHVFVLKQSVETYRFHQAQLDDCDNEIEAVVKDLVDKCDEKPVDSATPRDDEDTNGTDGSPSEVNEASSNEDSKMETGSSQPEAQEAGQSNTDAKRKQPRRKQAKGNAPTIDFHDYLVEICGVDLTAISGIGIVTVLILISEIGVDMSRWRNAKAFCSWLGLCPGNKISGGKVLDSRTRKVVSRPARALRMSVQSLANSDTCLGHFYRRKKAHLGPGKATTATARKLACVVYHMLKKKSAYQPMDPIEYARKIEKHRFSKLQKQATELGYQLVEVQAQAA